ncbi:CD276 antigen -like protein Precursor [Channa argus]|uniref:CD276 antigen-like protein n=1 Tax=Channa argus TaxID=215402 RepID=A0A6G1Q7H6_CHAAH|nr:CD276 antigen -like protein Precursor [Channa argus]KAF3698116.1 CD276 antigen -like protein Precursor [Channa argus]KAK2899589.1 hypothetical protein Q8A73_012718 [Channa argus]
MYFQHVCWDLMSCMSLSWILPLVFLNFAASFELKCNDMTVEAEADRAVILPCFTVPPEDLRQMTVEWVVNQTDDVHLFVKGEDVKDHIHKYNGRTSLFLNELTSGNCSLKLDPVHVSDNGVYTCSVKSPVGKLLGTCFFNLHEPTVLPEVGINNGVKVVAGVGVGLIALVLVGALCKKYAEKKKTKQPKHGDGTD